MRTHQTNHDVSPSQIEAPNATPRRTLRKRLLVWGGSVALACLGAVQMTSAATSAPPVASTPAAATLTDANALRCPDGMVCINGKCHCV